MSTPLTRLSASLRAGTPAYAAFIGLAEPLVTCLLYTSDAADE